MPESKADSAPESYKKHGDPLGSAVLESDGRNVQPNKPDPVPPAQGGSHPHSAAAYPGGEGKPGIKPAGNP